MSQYQTNWSTQNVTNTIPVQAIRTVRVTEYKTNWNVVKATNEIPMVAVRTNYVDRWRTNWKTLTLAKEVGVDATRTNFVEHWRTNWKTLHFTNWQTVLVMKTNWVIQPVTNLVVIDMVTNSPAQASVADLSTQSGSVPVETPSPGHTTTVTEELGFEVAGAARTGRNNLEVRLAPKWTSDSTASLRVQLWRVESENGAILCSGQDQEFKRDLPLGRYRVELKARRDDGGLLIARGTLAVSSGDAVILPKIARK